MVANSPYGRLAQGHGPGRDEDPARRLQEGHGRPAAPGRAGAAEPADLVQKQRRLRCLGARNPGQGWPPIRLPRRSPTPAAGYMAC